MRVLGVPFSPLDFDQAVERIRAMLRAGTPHQVVLANAHTLDCAWSDPSYGDILRSAALVLRDGVGVELAAALAGRRLPHNFVGTDFAPALLERLAQPEVRVFLYGAAPGVAETAGRVLRARCPGIVVVGTHHGYQNGGDVISEIRAARPDVLLVALGNPRQERWIAQHLHELGVPVAIGVGALFDYLAGHVPRAAAWVRRARSEWLYRFAVEPRRLWRRYLIGNSRFLWAVAKELLSERTRLAMSATAMSREPVLACSGRAASLEPLLAQSCAAGWLPLSDRVVVQMIGAGRTAELVGSARSLVCFLREQFPKVRVDVLDVGRGPDDWEALGARRIGPGRAIGVSGIAIPELRVPELWFQSYTLVTVVSPHPSPTARIASVLDAQADPLRDLGSSDSASALAYEAHRLAASDLVIACGWTRFGDPSSEPWWAVSPSDVLLEESVAHAAGIAPSRLPLLRAVARHERCPALSPRSRVLPALSGYAAPPVRVAVTLARQHLTTWSRGLVRDAHMVRRNVGKIPGFVRRRLASRGVA
ncbi:MAG TPA: WecB/TagA/CpsF family glycosyltransferase [Candidatus Dormibacteraeota bacterium]|nr:WecB/TagA/CpsF family glycosyltransferase [Candidatus Dormibacteraeota bacterium]